MPTALPASRVYDSTAPDSVAVLDTSATLELPYGVGTSTQWPCRRALPCGTTPVIPTSRVVFADPIDTRLWIAVFNASQACLGVLLLPVVIVTLVAPEQANSTLICAVILYFLARIVLILKGFRIYLIVFRPLFTFLLYFSIFDTYWYLLPHLQ